MKLILTSSGLKVDRVREEILNSLPKPANQLRLAHIITAANVASDTNFVTRDKAAMTSAGFQVTDIALEGKTQDELLTLLNDFDIIYVQGGNGFYLLKHIRESGFDTVVRTLLDQGKWYIGVSAGTYVCCPTIEMCTWKREPDNVYGLADLTAMHLVPFLITVHYNREKYREVLAAKLPTASYPVKILTDEQALLVEDGKVTFLGQEPEIRAEDIE